MICKLAKRHPCKLAKQVIKRQPTFLKDIHFPKGFSLQTVGITQSLYHHAGLCPVAWMLDVNRWVKKETWNTTGFGSLVHDVLDKIYTYFKKTGKIATNTMIEEFINRFLEEESEEMEGKTQDELEKDAGMVYVLMTEYVGFYEQDFYNKKFDEIEITSSSYFHGYKLMRKTDATYFDKSREKWIMENKTKGQINEELLLKYLSIDFQNLFYLTAEELRDTKSKVAGVLYNVIRRPLHRVGKNETLKAFLDRLRSEVQKSPDHFFKRYEIPYTEHDKQEFRLDLKQGLDTLNEYVTGKRPVRKNRVACLQAWPREDGYTIFPCDFLDACVSGKMAGYKQRKKLFPELDV